MGEVIRDLIGLTGLVMSDDLGMKALGGPFAERARAVIAAGCDVALHCSGELAEMVEVAERRAACSMASPPSASPAPARLPARAGTVRRRRGDGAGDGGRRDLGGKLGRRPTVQA